MEFRKTDTHLHSNQTKTEEERSREREREREIEFSSRLDRQIDWKSRKKSRFLLQSSFFFVYSLITLHVIDALIGFDKHFMSHRWKNSVRERRGKKIICKIAKWQRHWWNIIIYKKNVKVVMGERDRVKKVTITTMAVTAALVGRILEQQCAEQQQHWSEAKQSNGSFGRKRRKKMRMEIDKTHKRTQKNA